MKLNAIMITNFRNHAQTKLDLTKKVNLFIGPNGSGKSSIVDSMAFLLTGNTIRTKEAGGGLSELTTFGDSRTVVTGMIEGVGKVTRTIPHSFQVADWEGTMTEQQNKLYNMLGVSKESLFCSVYSSDFIDMPENDQKNYLFNLIGVEFSADMIKQEFETWCGVKGIISQEVEYNWNFLNTVYTLENIGPDVLDDIYEKLLSIRKYMKKDIKTLEVGVQDKRQVLPDGITVNDRDATVKALTDMRTKRDTIIQKLAKIKNINNIRKTLEDRKKKLQSVITPVETAVQLKTSITEHNQACKEVTTQLNKLNSKISIHEDTVNKLKEFAGKCYLGANIKCPLTIDQINKLISEETLKLTECLKIGNDYDRTIKDIYVKLNDLNIKLEQRSYIDIVQPEIEKYKTEIDKLSAEVNETEEALNSSLYNIDSEITNKQTLLTRIEAESYNVKLHNEMQQNLSVKTKELVIVELLVEAFGISGIKSILLNRILKPIEEAINNKLTVMTNNKYSVNFRVDSNDFNIYVISNGIERKIYHLSSSERWRIGVILQHAINILTGSKFLVVDNIDILDKDNKRFFWNFIQNIKPEYDSILLFSTGKEVRENTYQDTGVFFLK